jgi:hypothetical protein
MSTLDRKSYLEKYPLMPLRDVMKHEPRAEQLHVSLIARGKTKKPGFMDAYRVQGKNIDDDWLRKRHSFISRTLVAYLAQPMERRWLSLVMWAYWTKPKHDM